MGKDRLTRHVTCGALASSGMLAATTAFAHSLVTGEAGGVAGFLHPLTGGDHLLAMVSVGIWGVQLGMPAVWLLPVAFPLVMAFGGALGVIGVPLPGAEILVALSVLVLGALILSEHRLPAAAALAIVGVFAIAHGHAHGVELPHAADPLDYTVGFVVATGLLHLLGIALGQLTRVPSGVLAIKTCGLLIAMAGCYFLLSQTGA